MAYRLQLEEDSKPSEEQKIMITKDQQAVLDNIRNPRLRLDIYESLIRQEDLLDEER